LLAPVIDLADDPTPGRSACAAAAGSGDRCAYVFVAASGEAGAGELNGALLDVDRSVLGPMPLVRGLGPVMRPLAVDVAVATRAGVDDALAVQCGAGGILGKRSSDLESFASSSGAEVCFFHDDPGATAFPEVEACTEGACRLIRFTPDHTFALVRELPGEAWVWGDRDDGVTLLLDAAGAAFLRRDGDDALVPVLEGEAVVALDRADLGASELIAGVTADGRVLVERRSPGGQPALDAFPVADPAAPSRPPTGVSVAVAGDRVALAVTFADGGAGWPRPGAVGWTFLGLP
jgi:hypothetical protein